MKLTDIIKVWDIIHVHDIGELGYCDLERAIEKIVGVENDINPCNEIELVEGIKGNIRIGDDS